MLEQLLNSLDMAFRQKEALIKIPELIKAIPSAEFSFKKLSALLLALVEMIGVVVFDTAVTPRGQELNLDDYSLVFYDEFEGDTLDTDVWKYRALGPRRNGFNSSDVVEVKDGNLIINGKYLDDESHEAGWYASMISLKQKYLRGYFEIRCICNDGPGFWSAFWLQADNPYGVESNGGINGAEIDIFESLNWNKKIKKNSVMSNVHCNGFDADDENIDSRNLGSFKGNDIYNTYNTYGVEWTEDEYIFYVNGVESCRTSFGKGVSIIPEEVIVSLEIPSEMENEKDFTTQFVVDYVKIYQR